MAEKVQLKGGRPDDPERPPIQEQRLAGGDQETQREPATAAAAGQKPKETVQLTPQVVSDPTQAPVRPVLDPDEERVQMLFPIDVKLQNNGIMHEFKKGVNLVRVYLKDHWWLKANAVQSVK